MKSRSPRYRLRLLIVGLSLFCSGAAAIAWTGGAVLPQKISSPPDIEVVSHKWTIIVFKPGVSPRPAISSETIDRGESVNRPIPVDPMPVQVPNPNISAKPIERQSYIYSAEIRNRGQNEIKALKWAYVFSDPVTHEELKRLPTFGDVTIRPTEKKSIKFTTPMSPPRVVNANSPNAVSPFEESVIIECVVYADGSLWTNPQAKAGRCDNLRGYKR